MKTLLKIISNGQFPVHLLKHISNGIFIYFLENGKIHTENEGVRTELSQDELDMILDAIKDSDVHSIKVTDVSNSNPQHINLINDGNYIQRCN